jgi:uncharacterized delta-60 repeat protein
MFVRCLALARAAACVLFLLPAAAEAGPVTLDGTFGTGGRAASNFRGGNDAPQPPLRDAAGRYLFLSIADALGGASQVNVVRLTAAGALDPTFGDAGIATVIPTGGMVAAGGMTLDGAGRILVAYATDGETCNAIGVLRLTAAGALDAGFGTGGKTTVDPPGLRFGGCGSSISNGIAWNGEPSGASYRLALASTSTNAAGTAFHGTVTQLLESGTPDAAFGTNGATQLAVGTNSGFRGLAYGGNRIHAWGSRTSGSTDVLVARFQSFDGAPDGLFGSNGVTLGPGYVVSAFAGGNSVADAFVETSCPSFGGGCFYLAGTLGSGGSERALLARYIVQAGQCQARGALNPCLHTGAGAFDSDGWLALDLAGGTDEAFSLALDPGTDPDSQKIVMAGIGSGSGGIGPLFAARHLADGTPDTGWDGDGVLEDALGEDVGPRGYAVADADDELFLLARGSDGLAFDSLAGHRLVNGANDTGFGTAGRVRVRASATFANGNDLALDAGRPVVAGTVRNAVAARFELAIARFTANGQRDPAFDGDGQLSLLRAGDLGGEGYGVARQADGKLVVVGYTSNLIDSRLAAARVDATGALDPSFADAGWFRFDGVDATSTGRDVLVEASGRIVLLGTVGNGSTNDLVVIGLDAAGDFDPAFGVGGTGYTRLAAPLTNDGAAEIRPYPGGGYAVLGTAVGAASDAHVLLARLDADGLPLGVFVDAAISGNVNGRALALDASGRYYVGGDRVPSEPLVARFGAAGTLDPTWGNAGLASFTGLAGWIDALDLDSDGRPVASGVGTNAGSVEFVTYRLLADGSALDPDFDGDGRVSVGFATGAFANAQALGADGSVLLAGSGASQFALARLATRVASSVTLGVDVNPSQYNQGVTFTAIASGGAGTPTGTVELFAGPTSLGSAALVAGQATIARSDLEVGNYSIVANYSGDANYAPSSSTPALGFAVGKAASQVTLANLDPDQSTASGENVSFDLDASGAFGTVPGGNVELYVDDALFGTFALAAGSFTLTTDDLPPGAHTLHAVYAGDARHLASAPSADVAHTVGLATSGTNLQVAPSPSDVGQSVTLTATVGGQSGLTVTGQVEFRDAGVLLGTVALDGNGQAQLATSALVAGNHPLQAIYLGSASYAGSSSNTVDHVVGKRASGTTLMVAPASSTPGQNVTLTATVTGSGATPTGDVEFRDGGQLLATVTLAGGQAAHSTAALSTGSHALQAIYLGDATYEGSSSAPHVQLVGNRIFTSGFEGN